ncbi:MAG: beta-N-acetylhexosaminidase [Phocaeicola sp.]
MKNFLLSATALFLVSCGQTHHFDKSANDIVIPKPAKVVVEENSALSLKESIKLVSNGADKTSGYLTKELEQRFGLTTKGSLFSPKIELRVDSSLSIPAEGYTLEVTNSQIKVNASTEAGAFYGIQTLLQLIEAGKVEGSYLVAAQKIEDSPRFEWRSYMLDESRYFFGEEEVYKILDKLAELKMNVFHWHLTDDAGWRVEIKKYPLLTEIGSKRKDTEIGTWGSGKTAGKPHSGYYTQEQIKKVVKYAKERNIKIVPEIEMPGHASAAVAAYPWLGTKNEQIEVPVLFGKHYVTFDVIDPKVQEFLQDVVLEVIALFETDVIHIGGDEVRFNHWEEDKEMVAYKKAKGYNSFMDIQIEFSNNMSHFIENQGVSMMGWNEILGTNLHADDNISFSETSTKVAPNVVVQFWKGDINELTNAAKGGYRLVNSYHGSTYLDYSHNSIPLSKSYEFNPIPTALEPQYHKNIIGLGCQMWTEWVSEKEKLESQTFPRIAAYAEVAWSPVEVKEYADFIKRLKPVVHKWSSEGIHVHLYDELK